MATTRVTWKFRVKRFTHDSDLIRFMEDNVEIADRIVSVTPASDLEGLPAQTGWAVTYWEPT